jgi:hypothetical protein
LRLAESLVEFDIGDEVEKTGWAIHDKWTNQGLWFDYEQE